VRPIRLKVKNFLGIEEVDYEFEPGIFVMVGENGSGKSSFFEAIHFALFGSGIRFGKRIVKSYIRRNSKEALVDFKFERGGRIYRSVRLITPTRSRVEIYEIVNGKEKPITEEPNRFITELLGMDPDVFQTAFLIPQGRITNIMDKMSDLRSIIMKITGFEEKKKALLEVLKDMRRELENSSAGVEYTTLKEFLERSPTIDQLDFEIEKTISEIKEAQKKLNEVELEIDRLKRVAELDKKIREIEKLEFERESLREKANYEETAERLREVFTMLDREKELEEKKTSLAKDIKKMKKIKHDLDENIKRLSEAFKEIQLEIDNLEKKTEDLENESQRISSILDDSSPYLSRISEIKMEASSLAREIKSLEIEINRRENERKENIEKLGKLKREFEDISKEYEKLKKDEINFLAEKIAENLEIGDRCPVCGGIFNGRTSSDFKFNEERMKKLEKLRESLRVEIGKVEEKVSLIETEISASVERKREIQKSLESLKLKLEDLTRTLKAIGYEDGMEEKKRKIDRESFKLRKERDQKIKELQLRKDEISSIEKERERLKTSIFEKEKNMESVEKELESISKNIKSICSAAGVKVSEVDFYRKYLRGENRMKLREISAKIESLKSIVGEVNPDKIEAAKKKLENLLQKHSHLREIERKKSEELGKLRAMKSDISKKVKRFKELEKIVERENEDLQLIKSIQNSLSADGFDNYLFHRIIPTVVERASLRLRNIMAGKFSIKVLSEKGKEELKILDDKGNSLDYRSLSGGEKTVVALVMALSLSEVLSGGVELFFIDEGFSALDAGNRENVVDMLSNLEESGKTVIFITHLEDLAMKFERTIRMEKGRIVS